MIAPEIVPHARACLCYMIVQEVNAIGEFSCLKEELADVGLPVNSEAYAMWLQDSGVRMIQSRGKWQTFVRRMPPADLLPVMARLREDIRATAPGVKP